MWQNWNKRTTFVQKAINRHRLSRSYFDVFLIWKKSDCFYVRQGQMESPIFDRFFWRRQLFTTILSCTRKIIGNVVYTYWRRIFTLVCYQWRLPPMYFQYLSFIYLIATKINKTCRKCPRVMIYCCFKKSNYKLFISL